MVEGVAVLTVGEVADLLRLSRGSVYRGIHRGELPSRWIGRRVLIPKGELERFLDEKIAAVSESGEIEHGKV